jgi:NADH:ubiquinone oxidoreductase subunit 5 (subunit L)/multisubunit Na+/H+ antiporter MnhA subunit
LPIKAAAGAAFASGLAANAIALGRRGLMSGLGFDPFVLMATSLLAALGVVAAWMFESRSGPVRAESRAARRIARLARTAFHLDRFWIAAVVLPIRFAAQLCRLFDWVVIDGGTSAVSRAVPETLTRIVAPFESRPVQFEAIAVLLATGLLAAVLLVLAG